MQKLYAFDAPRDANDDLPYPSFVNRNIYYDLYYGKPYDPGTFRAPPTFRVHPGYVPPDVLNVPGMLRCLWSERVVRGLMAVADLHAEVLRAAFITKGSKKVKFEQDYYFVVPLVNSRDVVDKIAPEEESGTPRFRVREGFVPPAPLFRASKMFDLVVVTEPLAEVVRELRPTGSYLIPVNEVTSDVMPLPVWS